MNSSIRCRSLSLGAKTKKRIQGSATMKMKALMKLEIWMKSSNTSRMIPTF